MFNFPTRLKCGNIVYLCFTIFLLFAESTTSYKIGRFCKNEGDTRALSIGSIYLKCENGHFILKACTAGESFDHFKKECVVSFLSESRGSKTERSSDRTSTMTLPTQEPSSSFTTFTDGYTSENIPSDRSSTLTSPSQEPSSGSTPLSSGSTSESTPSDSPSTETSATQETSSEVIPTEIVTTEIWTSSGYPTTNEPTSEIPTITSNAPATITTSTVTTTSIPTTTTITPSTTTTPALTPTTTTTTASTTTTTASTTTTTASTTTTTTASTTTSTTSTSTTKPPIPECKTEGQKRIFKKGDCKDYLECDSGKWVKKTCSWGWDFDINKLDCVFSWWAKC